MVANKDNAKTTLCLQIIKVYLLRSNSKEGKEMSEKLNINATSPAYHLGRLLAIIERIQGRSNSKGKKLTVTIGNQYYKALKDNPKRVERLLNKVQTAYIPKLRRENKQGDIIYFEKLLSEVQPKASGLLKKLKPEECGMFDLGYRQQKTDFYKTGKAEDTEQTNQIAE